MKNEHVVVAAVIAGVALAVWHYQRTKAAAGAVAVQTNYPAFMGDPSPIGAGFGTGSLRGYVPTTEMTYDWLFGSEWGGAPRYVPDAWKQ